MTLTEKSRHKLVQRLRNAFEDEGTAKFVLTNALIDTGKLEFNGSIQEIWTGIVQKLEATEPTEDEPQLEKFLKYIVEQETKAKKDETLRQILDYLKNGYKPKLPLLAKAINEGRCVLFLGPNMLQVSQGQGNASVSFYELVARRIVSEFNRKDIYYDKSQADNLNYIAQLFSKMPEYTVGGLGVLADKLYQQFQENELLVTDLYEKLAKLPFRIIVNTNPDNLLFTIARAEKPDSCVERYYDPTRPEQDNDQHSLPNGTNLFYNLLGTLIHPESIQMTESQLMNFTSRMVNGKPPLDIQVRLAFNDQTTHYLFLGFDFDQWYMKLVIGSILGVSNQSSERAFSTNSTNKNKPFSAFNREFYEDEFKFYFIDEENIDLFVKKLVGAYKIYTATHEN